MKRRSIFIYLVLLAMTLSACGTQVDSSTSTNTAPPTTTESKEEHQDTPGEEKILIVYFAVAENSEIEADTVSMASAITVDGEEKGLSKAIADWIQEEIGGDVFSLRTETLYPMEDLLDYARQEQRENILPALIESVDVSSYDTIFVGYPLWWYDLPQVMYTFFDEVDCAGKTIIPFSTHNGSRFSGTIQTIQELEPDATVIEEGLTIQYDEVIDSQEDVSSWLEDLGY